MADSPARDGSARRPVLVVADDDALTRDLLTGIFRANGYDVVPCIDGQEAIDRVGRGGVDLVFLDAMMPRMSGLEACRVLKGMSAGSFLPVVLATVRTDPSSRVEGLKLGADDYVCKPFEEEELLARVAAMVKVKRLHEEMQAIRLTLERVSVRDELTGLHNYRYLHARLAEEFRRAERQHEPLACCIVNVDRLKVHNDAGGRPLGDAILRGIADIIRRNVREADVIARYGADEFLVLLSATHFAGSLGVAERIWRDIAATDWTPRGSGNQSASQGQSASAGRKAQPSRATVSVGVALYPTRDVRSRETLLRAADAALLHAKREGSNRICVFQQQGFIYTPNTAAPDKGPIKRSRSPYPARKRDA